MPERRRGHASALLQEPTEIGSYVWACGEVNLKERDLRVHMTTQARTMPPATAASRRAAHPKSSCGTFRREQPELRAWPRNSILLTMDFFAAREDFLMRQWRVWLYLPLLQ